VSTFFRNHSHCIPVFIKGIGCWCLFSGFYLIELYVCFWYTLKMGGTHVCSWFQVIRHISTGLYICVCIYAFFGYIIWVNIHMFTKKDILHKAWRLWKKWRVWTIIRTDMTIMPIFRPIADEHLRVACNPRWLHLCQIRNQCDAYKYILWINIDLCRYDQLLQTEYDTHCSLHICHILMGCWPKSC